MDTSTKGILTPHDIDEEGRYYFVRKAMDAGDVVRLKNGVYATQEGGGAGIFACIIHYGCEYIQ